MSQRNATIWIPLALAVAGVAMGVITTQFSSKLPMWTIAIATLVVTGLVAWAIYLAFQPHYPDRVKGGSGGEALVSGKDSRAVGGRGGDAGRSNGGEGGAATVLGNRSIAKGGNGGSG